MSEKKNEELLNGVIQVYQQKLADAELANAELTVRLQLAQAEIGALQKLHDSEDPNLIDLETID